ncbi:STAS domain-containing protein [Actinophytocola sp.]|uniref:STAS domain-containing protein n=1 Tax=Actinophytocola sp. TaxID=1872138 RepID=UPI00389A5D92
MTDLTITTRTAPHGHVLTVRGALDVNTSPRLRQVYEDLTYTAGHELVLDLTDLEFCDSSGISTFINARDHAASFGATFALAAVPARTTKMIATIGLGEFFTRYDTVDQANL